jgi:Zn-dependent protease with chaperone function
MKIAGLYDASEAHAPALHAALDDLCQKAGITKPTLTFVNAEEIAKPLHKFVFDHMAGALWLDKPRIVIGEKIRRLLDHHDLTAPISEDFKAVLAHEIGHIKYGDVKLVKVVPLRLSPVMGMVAGMAGIWYYGHLKDKAQQGRATGKPEDEIQAELKTNWKESDHTHDPLSNTYKHFLTAAKYVAGGLLGFAVGTAIFTVGHRHIEFRADRVSAELMGSGKPLADALGRLRVKLQSTVRENPDIATLYKKRNPVANFLESLMHPSDAERIERLNAWSR